MIKLYLMEIVRDDGMKRVNFVQSFKSVSRASIADFYFLCLFAKLQKFDKHELRKEKSIPMSKQGND